MRGAAGVPSRTSVELQVYIDASDIRLERLRQHDPGAIEVLYDQYADTLYGLALRWADQRGAEDLIEHTFVALWRRGAGWDPAKGGAFAYLFGIMLGEARSMNIHVELSMLITTFGLERWATALDAGSIAVFEAVCIKRLSIVQAAGVLDAAPKEMERRFGRMLHELLQFSRQ